MSETLREQLAALAHRQWSGWMEYFLSICQINEDGTATIPIWAVEGWGRQMRTPYVDLSEDEQESDRKEADRVLALLGVPGDCYEELDDLRAAVEADGYMAGG